MIWANDVVRTHFTYRAAQWHSFHNWGAFPLWDPTVFCGKSIVGDPLPELLMPLTPLFWLFLSPQFFGFQFWLYVTLGAWGMFLLCRKRGIEPFSAFLGAVMFSLNGKIGAHIFAGHLEVIPTILALPWLLLAVEDMLRRKNLSSSIWIGIALAIIGLFGNIQVLYLNVLFAFAYVLIHAYSGRDFKGIASSLARPVLLYFTGVFAFGFMGAVWWLPVVRQTLLLSGRVGSADYAFATMNSVSWQDVLRLIWPMWNAPIPMPLANDAEMMFFWETVSYPGVIALSFALAAPFLLFKQRGVLALFVVAILLVLVAMGPHTPFHRIAYSLIPGFSLFRAPGRLLFYVNFIVALLAATLASRASTHSPSRFGPAIAAGVLAQFALVIPLAMDVATIEPRWTRLLPLVASMLFASAAVLWAFRRIPNKAWHILCLAMLCIELGYYWNFLIRTVDVQKTLPDSSVGEFLATRRTEEEFRVLDLSGTFDQQLAGKYGVETISGYHPGVYGHYLEFYNKLWSRPQADIVEVNVPALQELVCPNVLNMMNVRYVITMERLLSEEYTEVHRSLPEGAGAICFIYERKSALPRAYLVANAVAPPPGLTAIDQVCAIDPKRECVVDDLPVSGNATFQELSITRASAGEIMTEFTSDGEGVVVISQTWHPDWRATDNGVPAEVRRVNHAQTGVLVGKGSHSLQIYYFPWDFYLGGTITLVSICGFALIQTVSLLGIRRARNTPSPGVSA